LLTFRPDEPGTWCTELSTYADAEKCSRAKPNTLVGHVTLYDLAVAWCLHCCSFPLQYVLSQVTR